MEKVKSTISSFTDLRVWREAHQLVLLVYRETKTFPKEELFGLVMQMRRASVSITSNIAHGSLTELQNQLLVSRDVNYLSVVTFKQIADQSVLVHKLLNAFIKGAKNFSS